MFTKTTYIKYLTRSLHPKLHQRAKSVQHFSVTYTLKVIIKSGTLINRKRNIRIEYRLEINHSKTKGWIRGSNLIICTHPPTTLTVSGTRSSIVLFGRRAGWQRVRRAWRAVACLWYGGGAARGLGLATRWRSAGRRPRSA